MSAPASRPCRLVLRAVAAGLASGLASACSDPRNHSQAVYMLVDTSGTYVQESDKAQAIVKYLLGTLNPGDSLAVAKVESRSFSEKDIVAKATFDTRPSQANARSARSVTRPTATSRASKARPSPTSPAASLGAGYLNETGADSKTLVIFSDMQEELDKVTGAQFPDRLEEHRVVAVNVVGSTPTTSIHVTSAASRRGRSACWRRARGWRVINDLERLDALFERT
jgi:hypothetical protein